MNFYLAQVSGALAWIFLFLSYWKNGNNKLLYLQVISCFFFAINYGFLGAFSGVLVVLFEMLRDYLYTKVKNPMKVFYICIPFYIIISIFSFENFVSLFSVFASLCDSYALTKKNKKVVCLGIVTYSLWLIYDVFYASYSTLIVESLLILSNIIILFKYHKSYLRSDKITFSRGLTFNTKIIDEFYKLNNNNFDKEFLWSKEKIENIIKENKTDFIFIHDEGEIIGYINFIIVSKEKYKTMLNDDTYIDIENYDIKKLNKREYNYINIHTISIKNSYQNEKTIKLISKEIKKYIKLQKRKRYKIKGIIAIAANEFENNIYEYNNFNKETKDKNNYYIYTLSDNDLNNYLKRNL